jgi:hypothetical protein
LFFVATEAHIYLDESGDTGWSFALPYTRGGSSRFLVIAASSLPEAALTTPEQLVRRLYKHRQWKHGPERKWARMSPSARTAFAVSAAKLARENPAIALSAVVVDKRRLGVHVRQDANTLYNYLVKHLLLAEMARHDRVQFRPDERAVPTRSGNSLHDYLQTELWFGAGAHTRLQTQLIDSRHSQNLQFVDMVSGAVHAHFEFGEQRNWALLEPHVRLEKLNFE